jgi:hypothetical protein
MQKFFVLAAFGGASATPDKIAQRFLVLTVMLAVVFFAAPAFAAQQTYTADLSGVHEPTNTNSTATGTATFVIDTDAQIIDAQIEIHGLKFDDLAHHLAHSRMGPIHLHQYKDNGDVELIVPFPFGDTYAETADGFTVTVHHYSYPDGQTVLGSNIPFEALLASLAQGKILLNVHTQRFGDGEISGYLVPAT